MEEIVSLISEAGTGGGGTSNEYSHPVVWASDDSTRKPLPDAATAPAPTAAPLIKARLVTLLFVSLLRAIVFLQIILRIQANREFEPTLRGCLN